VPLICKIAERASSAAPLLDVNVTDVVAPTLIVAIPAIA